MNNEREAWIEAASKAIVRAGYSSTSESLELVSLLAQAVKLLEAEGRHKLFKQN